MQPHPDLQWDGFGAAVGYRLRWLRQHRRLSQLELSILAGVHLNQVSNIERNVSSRSKPSDPHLSTLYRLAHALRVPPTLLLPDGERPPGLSATEDEGEVVDTLRSVLGRLEAGDGRASS